MKEYYKYKSFGTNLAVRKIGNIIYEDSNITIDDTKSERLRDLTLEKKESAHTKNTQVYF